ncbi:TPR-like protein [Penicillium lividum]|nr:TPR-like protein [Penicillium lividum]
MAIEEEGKQRKAPLTISALPFDIADIFDVPQFIGRNDELRKVHEILKRGDGRGTAVIQGSGGMGKAQLSVAYGKR